MLKNLRRRAAGQLAGCRTALQSRIQALQAGCAQMRPAISFCIVTARKIVPRAMTVAVAALFILATAIPSFAAPAQGDLITNRALFVTDQGNSNLATVDVTISILVRTPSNIEFLRYAPLNPGAEMVQVRTTDFSPTNTLSGPFEVMPPPALDISSPLPLVPAEFFHRGDPVFIRLTDLDQNLRSDLIESVVITLTASTGDREVLRLYETAVDSGIFVGYITSMGTTKTDGDGNLSVALESTMEVHYTDIVDNSDASSSAGFFDPLGTVFDSTTGNPVSGVTITIFDVDTGQPAIVYGDGGPLCSFPSSVVSGGSITDSCGQRYDFLAGGYRFPSMETGNYQIVLQTPNGWVATLPTPAIFPGGPWTITPGSFGAPFVLDPIPILRMDIPVDPVSVSLWVEKDAAKNVVAIGDFLPYLLKVTNRSDRGIADDVTVTDLLPRGFRYRKGSTRVDGVPSANPLISADGRTLLFALEQIAPKATRTISYVVEVAAGAVPGEAINAATASAPGGLTSNNAQKGVKVTEDLFRSSSLIVGQVLDGCDENARGIPGVRIYLEDGSFVITDKEGLYHFEGVRPIAHVVQLDTITLPQGYSPVPCEDNTRFAGQNFSQFVELQGGTLWRADFYAGKPSVSPTVSQGLTGLTLTSTITERRVRYRIEIRNETVAVNNLKLALKLPTALSLLAGTTVIDDLPANDPELAGEEYRFNLSPLPATAHHVVTFEAIIPDGAAGEMLATATLAFDTTDRKEQKTPEAINNFMVTRTSASDYKDFVMTTHFDFGLADLKEEDAKALADFAQAISSWNVERIELVGHTDWVHLSKKTARLFRDNLGLSHARSATIARTLTSLLHLPAGKIVSSGKGELEPIADNRRESGRAANRRVEIKVFLSKDRIEAHVAPVLMDSGLKQVTTSETLLPVKAPDDLAVSKAVVPTPAEKAGILSPANGTTLTTAISAVRVNIPSRLKPVLLLDDREIPADRIGFTMVDKESNTTLYSYIGVDFGAPGSRRLVLRAVDPFGNVRFEETAAIVRTGEVASIRLTDEGQNVADGKTPIRVRIELRDAAGEVIPAGISLVLKDGNLHPPRAAAPIDQSDLNIRDRVEVDGDGWVEFRPVAQSGAYRTRLVYGDNVAVEIETYVKPDLRDWILVGVAEGTVGYNTVSGNMQSLTAEEQDEEYYDNGRVAFFAKGKIKGDWLLTAAYDTAKPKVDKLHGTIDPDAFYTLYGDGTDQQYDAPSAKKLYFKMERDQFYALFGDYDTGLTVTELASYSRSLNGVKSEMKSRHFSYNAFASETSQAFVREEIPGDGTSGLYHLKRRDLIINSEKIVIETRDRFHSEKVLETVSLNRHIDYNIDYDAGTLYFREPIASRDSGFNPIVVVVDYETVDDREAAISYGGRAAIRTGELLEIGVSHVHEGTVGAEANLTAVDTTIKLGESQFRAEAATSKTSPALAAPVEGNAYLAELSHQGKDADGRIYVREQESGFGLGQQSSSESGSRKIGSDARYRLNDKMSVMGELSRQSMLDTGAERDLGQIEVNYQEERYGLRTGLRQSTDRTESGGINRSTQLLAGGNWKATKRLNLRLSREQSILNEDASADFPTRTLLGLDYQLSEKISSFVEQEFTVSDAQKTDMTRAGLKASPWDGAQMQSTVEQQGSEYGPRVFATTGLKQTWKIDEAWSADAAIDRSQTLHRPGAIAVNAAAPAASGGAEDFTALALGANRKAEKWTLSNRIEFRTSDSEDKIGLYSGAEGEIRRGLALSGLFQVFDSHRTDGSRSLDGSLRLGVAYRPVQTRWIIFDRLDYLFDREETPTTDFSNWRLVNNLNANFRPNRQTQISLQYGAKYVQEHIDGQDFSSYTDLPGIEGRYDISPKWDVGLRASLLHSWSSNQLDYSAGPSVGYRMMKNAWLSVGYNLTGFQDADFSAADFTAQGPFVRFRFKFDQNTVRDALKQF